jgi:hypothetical protein
MRQCIQLNPSIVPHDSHLTHFEMHVYAVHFAKWCASQSPRLLYSNCDNHTLDHLRSSRIGTSVTGKLSSHCIVVRARVFSSQFVKLCY